jgi:hypothetical protein
MIDDLLRQRCDALLVAMLGKDLASRWWSNPNKAFADETPEVIFNVAPNTVYAYLLKSAEGEW